MIAGPTNEKAAERGGGLGPALSSSEAGGSETSTSASLSDSMMAVDQTGSGRMEGGGGEEGERRCSLDEILPPSSSVGLEGMLTDRTGSGGSDLLASTRPSPQQDLTIDPSPDPSSAAPGGGLTSPGKSGLLSRFGVSADRAATAVVKAGPFALLGPLLGGVVRKVGQREETIGGHGQVSTSAGEAPHRDSLGRHAALAPNKMKSNDIAACYGIVKEEDSGIPPILTQMTSHSEPFLGGARDGGGYRSSLDSFTASPRSGVLVDSGAVAVVASTLQGGVAEASTAAVEAAGSRVSGGGEVSLTLKMAGIHWWFRSRSHAAELTAGYYNTATRDGYASIVDMCARHRFGLTLTCIEMCDTQHPPSALCGPEGLLKQVRSLCAHKGVHISGENALPIFLPSGGVDTTALDRIVYNTRTWHGAAAMAAYWTQLGKSGPYTSVGMPLSSGGGSGGMIEQRPQHGQQANSSPDGSLHDGSGGGVQQGQGGLYRHNQYFSLGTVLGSYSRISDCGVVGMNLNQQQQQHYGGGVSPVAGSAGHHGGRTSGGMFRTAHSHGQPLPQLSSHHAHYYSGGGGGGLHPARSDPAIAATGLRADSYADISDPLPPMRSFTFLRLGPEILQSGCQAPWVKFVWKMREGGFC